MLKVIINNENISLPCNCSLEQAITIFGVTERVFAVAVNGEIIPRRYYLQTILQENWVIDIIIPMQGG